MPTAAGAAGRGDGGGHGLKKQKTEAKDGGSYLEIYQKRKKRKKIKVTPIAERIKALCEEDEDKVGKEEAAKTNGSAEDQTSGTETSGTGSSGEKSRKSRLCVLL